MINKTNFFKTGWIFIILIALAPQAMATEDVFDMDLSSLMEMQITSAGRKEQNLEDVASAIYVISADDIRKSSATSLPELLRMVPGIQVGRISSNRWAVASRGFNGIYSAQLLVQIDGRTVYTPSFSGVYWDQQVVPFEEIERIEIIRGPGATVWGANAVNGVINIITKSASDATGMYVSVGSGNYEHAIGHFGIGKQLGKNTYGKTYLQYNKRGAYDYYDGDTASAQFYKYEADANDDWHSTTGGFRLDGDVNLNDSWTLQGDMYSNHERQDIFPYWHPGSPTFYLPALEADNLKAHGHNLLARWEHRYSPKSNWSFQFFYDNSERKELILNQKQDTINVDFQHQFQPFNHHDIVWGAGYRHITEEYQGSEVMGLNSSHYTSDLYSFFVQDEIAVIPEIVFFTIGSKFEHNDYTGDEYQPSARLLWHISPAHSMWTAVSKAIRTPSRFEHEMYLIATPITDPATGVPTGDFTTISGGEMESETVIAYEAGYRYKQTNFAAEIAVFYNDYKKIRAWDASDMSRLVIANGAKGSSHGLELTIRYQPARKATSELVYSYIDFDMDSYVANPVGYPSNASILNSSSPKNQLSLHLGYALFDTIHVNLFGRYIDEQKITSLTAQGIAIDAYLGLDANIIWSVTENVQFKLAGQNLTDPHHLEFISEYFTAPTEVGRSVYGQLSYNY